MREQVSVEKSSRKRVALAISYLLSTPMFAVYVLLYLFVEGIVRSWLELVLGIIFLCVLPVLLVVIECMRGRTDIFVTDVKLRPRFFVPAVISYACGSIVFALNYNIVLSLLSLAYATVTTAFLLASFKTKVSVHMGGLASPITFLTVILGPKYCLLYILLIPVFWSRKELKAHTTTQLISGTLIAVIVTILTVLPFL